MSKELLVNGFSNVSAEGITLHFTEKVSLRGGVSGDTWWFSWDKIGQSLFPTKYCELSVAGERRRIEKVKSLDSSTTTVQDDEPTSDTAPRSTQDGDEGLT